MEDTNDDRYKVTLWSDSSSEAKMLEERLQERGYVVERVSSGAETPIVRFGYLSISGYSKIYSFLG